MVGNGDYGSDTVILGHNENEGTVLPNHTIAQIKSKDYFLGKRANWKTMFRKVG
jgi:hypothetical protein